MRPNPPKLDKYGFPIPPGFGDSGVDDPSPSDGSTGRRIRFVLRMALLAALLTAVWMHFDLGRKARDVLGEYFGNEAKKLYINNRDLPRALAAADRAVSWSPENVDLLLIRGELKYINKDFRGALADFEAASAADPTDMRAQGSRRELYHVLAMHAESAAAASQLLERGLGNRAELLNGRAYSRALGGFELEAALKDINEAIKLEVDDNAAFLDTRGYILLKLGKTKEAMTDLNKAIELTEREQAELQAMVQGRDVLGQFARNFQGQVQRLRHNLAVMIHHRGETHEKLGEKSKAEEDYREAERYGFDPAAGVY